MKELELEGWMPRVLAQSKNRMLDWRLRAEVHASVPMKLASA